MIHEEVIVLAWLSTKEFSGSNSSTQNMKTTKKGWKMEQSTDVVFVTLVGIPIIWRPHRYRWRAANFDIFSALMAIEQGGFFSVPHLQWHGTSVYRVHFEGTWHTPIAERSLPVLVTLSLLRLRFEHPTLRLRDEQSYRQRIDAAAL